MSGEKRKSISGFVNESEDNAYTTKFLELLIRNKYVWCPNDLFGFKISLGQREKAQFLSDFNQLYNENTDEFVASDLLSSIKETHDAEYNKLLVASEKKDKSTYSWFPLAHWLFRERKVKFLSGFPDISIENANTTKFLELLVRYNYAWSSEDQEGFKISLGQNERAQFLHEFQQFCLNENFDEFQASVSLNAIKEIHDQECCRLLASENEDGTNYPWFPLAHWLFRQSKVQFIWGLADKSTENAYTFKFLELLVRFKYIWFVDDLEKFKVNLGRNEISQFLLEVKQFGMHENLDEFQAAILLRAIKNIHDEECSRLFLTSEEEEKSNYPWFSLAHWLFREGTVKYIWGYAGKSKENAYTTKFLELLVRYKYVWTENDQEEFKTRLEQNEKCKFLHEFKQFSLIENFDEFQAIVSLSAIKEIHDEECRRLLSFSMKENKANYDWFSLAHWLFRERVVKFIWGCANKATENDYTTNFLELLMKYRYVWTINDQEKFKISLGQNEKAQFLHEFKQFRVNEGFDELQASLSLSAIKEIYDEYKCLLLDSKKKADLKYPWFFLANQLFQERMGRDISVQKFKRRELLSFYNHLIDADLLIISNRNIHLQAIHREFLKFKSFVTETRNIKNFRMLLIPMFQHLYLLLRINCGRLSAERFIAIYKGLTIHPYIIRSLVRCKTLEDLQSRLISQARIRVKLSSNAYHILINWLRDCFSESLELFNILRVLHENFHLDMYHDKDDIEFSAVEAAVLKRNKDLKDIYDAQNPQKKSKSKVTARSCKTTQCVENLLTKKISELKIKAGMPKYPATPRTPETPSTSESNANLVTDEISELEIESEIPKSPATSRTPETPSTSESDGSSESSAKVKGSMPYTRGSGSENYPELKASDLKLRDSARRYLEELRIKYQSGWDIKELEQALLNPPDPNIAVPSGNDGDGAQAQHSMDIDKEMNAGNNEDGHLAQDIMDVDQDINNDSKEIKEENEDKKLFFKKTYRTDFHSTSLVTLSGKDCLCSSDVSPDLQFLACGFESCKICVWRLLPTKQAGNGFELKGISTLRGHKGIVYALSIDSNTKTLISGSHDHTVKIWDIYTCECLYDITQHSAPVYAVCASPNSRYFLSASEDKQVVLFWYDHLYPVQIYSGHTMEAINCVKFHPNCAYFACACSDGNLFLFKINSSCPVRMFCKHVAKVYTLAFSPCGKQLASADVEGMLVIWDILAYAPIKICETGQGIRSISYDKSGSFITALFYFKSWKVYNIEEDDIKLNEVIKGESVGVPKSIHFSPENKMVIVQFVEADKSEIEKTKRKPKTKIDMIG